MSGELAHGTEMLLIHGCDGTHCHKLALKRRNILEFEKIGNGVFTSHTHISKFLLHVKCIDDPKMHTM